MKYLLVRSFYAICLLIANLLSVYIYAAEYKFTSKYNLDAVVDDNWLGVRDTSTSEKEEVYGSDLAGFWELGYREKNVVIKGNLNLVGTYRDYQDYDNVNEKASISFKNANEKNQITLFANHNRRAARDFSETIEGSGQLDVSNVELVNTDFRLSSSHALNQRNTLSTSLVFIRRDSDSREYSDYEQFGSTVKWVYSWTSTFSPQFEIGYTLFEPDDSEQTEVFSPALFDDVGSSPEVAFGACQLAGITSILDQGQLIDCTQLRRRDSQTVSQTFRIGGVYLPTEKIEINFLVGKVFVDQDIKDDYTDFNLNTGDENIPDQVIKTETTTNSYDFSIRHRGIRNTLSLNASLGERVDSVGNLTETTRIELSSIYRVTKKSSFRSGAYWVNEDYEIFSSDDREINRYSFNVSYNYRFLREWSMAFKYFYIQTDNDLVDGKVERNRVRFSILWRPKDTIWSR